MALEQPAPAPQPNADDDFAAAFDSFAQPEPAAPAVTDPPEPAPVATDPPEPAPVVDPPIVEPPAAAEPPAAEPPAEPPAAVVAPEPAPAEPAAVVEPPKVVPTADDILNRLDQIRQQDSAHGGRTTPAPAAAEDATSTTLQRRRATVPRRATRKTGATSPRAKHCGAVQRMPRWSSSSSPKLVKCLIRCGKRLRRSGAAYALHGHRAEDWSIRR
jgi:outer membrane biosynthesis protein TonB